jgi:hypothetical protein
VQALADLGTVGPLAWLAPFAAALTAAGLFAVSDEAIPGDDVGETRHAVPVARR